MATGQAVGSTASSKPDQRKANRHTLYRVMLAFRPYTLQGILVLVAVLLTTLIDLINPLVVRLIFDEALGKRNLQLLFIYVSVLVITPIISGVLDVGQAYLSNVVGQRVMRDFRNRLYEHLQKLSFHFFTSTRVGEIQSRLSNDVGSAQNTVTTTMTRILANLALVLSTILAMIYISPVLTLISLGLFPLMMWITKKVGNVRRQNQKRMQQSLASLTALMQETLSVSGILLIKTFGRQQFALSQFSKENQQLTDLGIRQQMIGRWFFMFVNMVMAVTPAVVYLVAGWQIISHPGPNAGITLGGIVAFTTLQTRLLAPLAQLLNIQVEIQGALALFDRIFEYLDLPIEMQDKPDALCLSVDRVQGEVCFKNVTFRYERAENEQITKFFQDINAHDKNNGLRHRETLRNISFHVQPGQLVALVGPSGAGKTTITYLVPRLYDVDSGSVEIDGYNVKDLKLSSLSGLIGTVTQEPYLFHTSIRENLLYARPEASEREMIEAAKAAAIHDRIMALEEGYDTVVGERGYKLSGGEKQRLAIARVLLKNPRILILDEATSALDTHSERLIQAALVPLMKGRTTFAIAHRLSTILAADMILVVDEGEIVERGTHQSLLMLGGLYAKLYREQFSQEIAREPTNGNSSNNEFVRKTTLRAIFSRDTKKAY